MRISFPFPFAFDSARVQPRGYSWYYAPPATCGRMCMPEGPRGLSRTIGRIVSALGGRVLSDSRFVESDRTAPDRGLLEATRARPAAPILAHRCSLYIDLESVVVSLKWTPVIVSENFYRRVFLASDSFL